MYFAFERFQTEKHTAHNPFCSVKQYKYNNFTFPMNAEEPPRRAIPTATLAGAPPGAFLKAGASASDKPLTVGTKSISNSPKHTTCGELLVSGTPSLKIAFVRTKVEN